VRPTSRSAGTCASWLRISSARPSPRYSWSRACERSAKGSTATEAVHLRLRMIWSVRSCLPSSVLRRYHVDGALVGPERTAAEQQEQREDRELRRGDPLMTAFAVVPGEHEDEGKPMRSASVTSCWI